MHIFWVFCASQLTHKLKRTLMQIFAQIPAARKLSFELTGQLVIKIFFHINLLRYFGMKVLNYLQCNYILLILLKHIFGHIIIPIVNSSIPIASPLALHNIMCTQIPCVSNVYIGKQQWLPFSLLAVISYFSKKSVGAGKETSKLGPFGTFYRDRERRDWAVLS